VVILKELRAELVKNKHGMRRNAQIVTMY